MEFVGQYREQKKLADALRRQASSISGMGADTSPIVTQASGAFPGQVNANYGGPLAQIGLALMSRHTSKKADAAEAKAEEQRMEALRALTTPAPQQGAVGNGAAGPATIGAGGGKLTPESVVAMQELGIDPSAIKLMMPDKPQLGAVTQAAQTEAGIDALVATGVFTPEQGAAQKAGLAARRKEERENAREDYKFEQDNKKFAPPAPSTRALSEMEFAMQFPEEYKKIMQTKGLSKTPQGNPYSKKMAEEQAKVDVKLVEGVSKIDAGIKRADELIEQFTKKPYEAGTKWRAADSAAKLVGFEEGALPSNYDEDVQLQEQAINQFHLDAMEQMRGFGQVTEAEQGIIRATQFDRYDEPEVRVKKIQTIRDALQRGAEKAAAAQQRMKAGVPVLPAAGTMKSKSGIKFTVE